MDTPLVSTSSQPPSRHAPATSPIERLLEEPYRFEFNQAVRLLHALLRRLPADERPVVRFRNTLSLSFPASEVMNIDTHRRPDDSDGGAGADASDGCHAYRDLVRVELTPAFMGLLGAIGALPLAYTEQFTHRETFERDGAARAFLDIFQTRAVTLFHEAWRKHRLPLQFEADRHDRYLPLAMSLGGLGEPALRRRLHGKEGGVADDALAFYAGLLQRRVVSADHLGRVLANYFAVPVRVTQFVGRWFDIEVGNQLTLAATTFRLGCDTVLGPRAWQRDMRVQLRFGPMNRMLHRRFLPGGPAALALRELLRMVNGVRLEYEVQLILQAADVTGVTLSSIAHFAGAGARLGWDSFLISHPGAEDRGEAVYDLQVPDASDAPEPDPYESTMQVRDLLAMAA